MKATTMSEYENRYSDGTFLPGNPGRPRGIQNRITLLHREFCRGIIESPEYRASLVERIMSHTLPAAVEVMLHWYAYGKPQEQKDNSMALAREELTGLTTEELLARAHTTARNLLNLKEQQDEQRAHLRLLPPEESAPTEDAVCLDEDASTEAKQTVTPGGSDP
jgi:hypothetical protein